ncbi:YbaB/EbfC family nucleoid-associated protein [Lentzea nigeriaca]|uniref:YbaB/EbfC family nucleoid-associated protein n=1 Tax=Lentzea nigeriaca TaxID=1128665 RepID=UPI00195EA562|nr:YbaB/EbfC family nucleoid-associated protein [Lentzea nigeriaca]
MPGDRLSAAMRSFQEQADKAKQLQEAIKTMRGVGKAPDAGVTVTVAPSGAVLDLRLEPKSMGRSHTALQQAIIGAIREATANAAAQMEEAAAPLLGDRMQQFRAAMGANAGENLQIRPDAPQPPPPPTEEYGGSVLQRQPPQPPAPPIQPPVQSQIQPQRRPAPPVDDDDDFGSGSVLR